jgi:uncharacterized OB-fold protein
VSDRGAAAPYGDPLHGPFWEAAARHELVIQRCGRCRAHQFFARPFCVACGAEDVGWVPAAGLGTVYSLTTVHRQVSPDLPVPYVNALVQLDEGPRLLTRLVGGPCAIGDRVQVRWQARAGAPPLPLFAPLSPGSA